MATKENKSNNFEEIWEEDDASEEAYSEGIGGSSTPIKNRLQIDFWGTKGKVERSEVAVSDLSPGLVSNEDLKIRVTYSGKLFVSKSGYFVHTFFGMGSDNHEISFTSFGKTAQKTHDFVKENSIYTVTNFTVKKSLDCYRKCHNNLEIRLQSDSGITEVLNDENFPPMPFNFKTINEINSLSSGEVVDFLAIVAMDFGCEEITKTLSGKEKTFKKRDLLLTDDTMETMLLTLWSPLAESGNIPLNGVIAVRNAELYKISGTLAMKFSDKAGTFVMVKPTTKKATELKDWFDKANPHKREPSK